MKNFQPSIKRISNNKKVVKNVYTGIDIGINILN